MRALLKRIEPTLGPEEEGYRLHVLAQDRAQVTGTVLLVLLLLVAYFAIEFTFLTRQELLPIAVVRAVFFAFTGIVYLTANRLATPAALDRSLMIWSTGLALQFVALTLLRAPSPVDDVVMLMVLGFYALSPSPLLERAVPAITLTAGYLLVLWLGRGIPLLELWPEGAVLCSMNAIGIWASARLQTQRRSQYRSQENLRRSILERDALIDRLRQSHKMESMGRIVGGVAHDFNNILGTMLAAVDFLLEEIPAGSAPRDDAETIREAVMRGAELTQQLLAFSRQQVLEPRVVSLNELVSDTQRMLMRTIGEDIAIRVALGEHLAAVRVDPGQIRQILLNLSVNARDAMPAGGTLAIHTRNAALGEPTPMSHSTAKAGNYVVLAVSDDGTGMTSETLAQIFEPFFTTKPKGRGTGLGLSTVFGIVEQSGGHLRVTSAPGRGTSFEIFLPAVEERPAALRESREPPLTRGSETILLAEDDETLRTLTGRVLRSQGYHVLEASDGVEALQLAEGHAGPLDLLTTDMVMPSMGGHDLASVLTARQPGLKVLFVSGYTDDAIGRGELQPGDAFLQKPVDPSTLARKIRQLLDAGAVR